MNIPSFDVLLGRVNNEIVSPLLWIIFGLAVIYFLYGILVFVKNADSADKRAEGGKHIMWGLIGMFIMISTIGIINLILGTMSGQ